MNGSSWPVRIGGVLRCCFMAERPAGATDGTTVLCQYCGGGLKLVTRENDSPAWEARWITEGHDKKFLTPPSDGGTK